MAKKPKTDKPVDEPQGLGRWSRVQRAFSSQGRATPIDVLTDAEVDAFAALVGGDGKFVEGIREMFAALFDRFEKRRDEERAARLAADPNQPK